MRFWSVLGAFRGGLRRKTGMSFWTPLAAIFGQKSKKGVQKGIQKSMLKKVRKLVGKLSENGAKMGSKIDEKASRFRNLRFIGFCREYNVKIVFLHDQGYQKSIKSHSNIDANSMLEKIYTQHEQCSKLEPIWEPQSRTNLSKTRSENLCGKRASCLDPPGGSAAKAGAPLLD